MTPSEAGNTGREEVVKRFTFGGCHDIECSCCAFAEEDQNGGWVAFSDFDALRSKYDVLQIGFNSAKEEVKLLAEQLGGFSLKAESATYEIDRLKKACEQENQAFEDMSRKYDVLRKAADGMVDELKRLMDIVSILDIDSMEQVIERYEAAKGGETSCISFNPTTGEINGEDVGDGALKPLSKKSAKGLEGKK